MRLDAVLVSRRGEPPQAVSTAAAPSKPNSPRLSTVHAAVRPARLAGSI
jgi:hypothetical protein